MPRRVATALVLAASLLLPLAAAAGTALSPAGQAAAVAAPAAAPEAVRELDALLAGYFPADAPGAAVLVRHRGEDVLRKGYGLADLELGVPIRPEHVFRLGSITKQFTAAAVLELVEEGKLALDGDVGAFFPAFAGKGVTVEHLLTHTSGIPSYTDAVSYVAGMRQDVTVDEMIARFDQQPLQFAPGTKWAYSNSGYFLLGALIEKASGVPYAELLRQRVLAPLALEHVAYGDVAPIVRDRVPGYSRRGESWVNAPYLSMTQPYAAGSLLGNVDDLARWQEALAAGELLRPDLLERAWSDHALADGTKAGYGYGWAIGSLFGRETVEHGGGINGYSTFALSVPSEELFVAVLANTDSPAADPGYVAAQAAALVLGEAYQPAVVELPAERVEDYVGVYLFQDGVTRTISREGSRLFSQRSGGDRLPLLPLGGDRFAFDRSFTWLAFGRDAEGRVAEVEMTARLGAASRGSRVAGAPVERPAVALPEATLERYVGRYELAPGFVLAIRREGTRLFGQATGQPELEIFAEREHELFARVVEAGFSMQVAPDGTVTGLVLRQGGVEMPARRLP